MYFMVLIHNGCQQRWRYLLLCFRLLSLNLIIFTFKTDCTSFISKAMSVNIVYEMNLLVNIITGVNMGV